MGTKINLYKQSGTDDGTSVNFNVPRSLTYGLNARSNDDGGVTESDNCEYNTLNGLGTLLKSASLVLTPNSYKEGKLYSVIPNTGAGDMSVTRATTATRVNSAGLVELVPYNLVTYSEQFDNADWTKNNISITANTTTAPNGTTTADKLIPSTSLATHRITQNINTLGICTASFYVKASGYKKIGLQNNVVGGGQYFTADISTKQKIDGNETSYSFEDAPNGFVRVIVTMPSGTTQFGFFIYVLNDSYTTGNPGLYDYIGDGTSGIYLWGGQLVEGSTAKDYQKTETRLNIPRLDYSNGTCPSLLVEPQRTNSCLYSEQFDNAAWSKDNVTVTANSNISPDGTQNADTIIGNGINTSHYIYNSAYSVVSGNIYTISTYAKKNTNNFIQLLGFTSAFGVNVWANFDLNNGVVGSFGSATTAKIEDAGNGWYRCSITGQATSTTSTVDILFLVTSATSIRAEVNTLSTSVNLWGFQSELGSYPTSYIPTTSASVTRNADVVSKTGISSLIGQSEGTIFYEGSKIGLDTSEFYISDGTYNNFIKFQYYLEFDIIFVVTSVGGATQGFLTTSAFTVSDNLKIAIKYKTNDFALWVNGTEVATDTSGTTFASNNLNRINLGQPDNNSAGVFKANIKALSLWKTALTNTQLAQLTTI